MAAKRRTDTLELGEDKEIVVTSEALGYEQAEDLLPEIMEIVSSVFETAAPAVAAGLSMDTDVAKLLPVLGVLARQVGGGRLRRLAPRILAGTSVVMPDPENALEKIQLHLVKVEDRAMCFEARPDLYFAILFFAGKVTFGRFFPAGALGKKKAPPKAVAE